jgi:hypothetical protein
MGCVENRKEEDHEMGDKYMENIIKNTVRESSNFYRETKHSGKKSIFHAEEKGGYRLSLSLVPMMHSVLVFFWAWVCV